jgi:hypothetical protein
MDCNSARDGGKCLSSTILAVIMVSQEMTLTLVYNTPEEKTQGQIKVTDKIIFSHQNIETK